MTKPFKLEQTCGGCPESYNVFHNGVYVGYIHLRHGWVSAYYGSQYDSIYSSPANGDGIFEENEREFHLNEACKAFLVAISAQPEDLLFEIE